MFVCTDSDCDLFAARGILDNFEILAAVLLPNTTTAHNVTYKTHQKITTFSVPR